MSDFLIASAMKAQQWERAKGELRALVAIQGSHQALGGNTERFVALHDSVEAFIKSAEDEGLCE
jgi:hypothetical protein